MNSIVMLIGGTGLVGESFLKIAGEKKQISKVISVVRKNSSGEGNSFIEEIVIDFNNKDFFRKLPDADVFVCAIGTTIRNAGSQENFRRVDYDIPLRFAEYVHSRGTAYYILVSSVGADPSSKIFYNRVKGEVERDLQKIPFRGIHILRPSLLLGKRNEFRTGERIAQLTAGIYSVFLPSKYKPVKAETVAGKIHSLCVNPAEGVHIYEAIGRG